MDKLTNTVNELIQKLSLLAPDAISGLVAMQRASFEVSYQWAWITGIAMLILVFLAWLSFRADAGDEGILCWAGAVACVLAALSCLLFVATLICFAYKPVFEAAPQVYVIKQLLGK